MRFSDFQTESGTLKKMVTNGFGDDEVDSSLAVQVDPDFGFKQAYTDQQEQVSGRTTIITSEDPTDLQGFWEDDHYNWVLTYKSKDWKVIQANPSHKDKSNTLEYVVLILT